MNYNHCQRSLEITEIGGVANNEEDTCLSRRISIAWQSGSNALKKIS